MVISPGSCNFMFVWIAVLWRGPTPKGGNAFREQDATPPVSRASQHISYYVPRVSSGLHISQFQPRSDSPSHTHTLIFNPPTSLAHTSLGLPPHLSHIGTAFPSHPLLFSRLLPHSSTSCLTYTSLIFSFSRIHSLSRIRCLPVWFN